MSNYDAGDIMFMGWWRASIGLAMAGFAAWRMGGWWAVLLVAGAAIFLFYLVGASCLLVGKVTEEEVAKLKKQS